MKYQFKTSPYKHQLEALKKTVPLPRGGGLPMEMGTGKTKVMIDYACIQEQMGRIDRVLILCPLSVIGVWELQIPQHAPENSLNWKIINYDKVWRPHYFEQLSSYCRGGKTLLVCDEAHVIKNPQAKRTKAVFVLGQLCERVIWATGTPMAKHPLDYFAYMKPIDEAILGGSWGVFKRTYAVWGGYGGYQLIKYMNLKQLMERVEPYVYKALKKDCLDLPRKTHQIIPVRLDKSRRIYDRLARESIAEFEGLEVETPIVLTRLLRLSQLTGGHLVGDGGSRVVGTEKLDVFTELVEEMYEEDRHKIVVFCRFLDDLKDCARVCSGIGYKVIPFHGKTPRGKRDRLIDRFHETREPTIFLAQIATGSMGIDLTPANECIFFSHDYAYWRFEQACDRLHRIGQRRPVTYYHLLARDTVDEAVWLALRTKRAVAKLVMGNPALITD